MQVEIDVKFQCGDCNKTIPGSDVIVRCDSCDELCFHREALQECLENATKTKSWLWEDKSGYVGFDSDKELECFLLGIRKGYSDALFDVCDYFGMMQFFDTLEFKEPSWREK